MKTMKLFALILSLALALACLAACGGGESTSESTKGETAETTESTEPADSTDAKTTGSDWINFKDNLPFVDLTDGSYADYDYAKLCELFPEEDMSVQTRVKAFGIITVIKENGENNYRFKAVLDKTLGDDINRNSDGVQFPGTGNYMLFDPAIPEEELPTHGALVNVTFVYAQDLENKWDNFFYQYVEEYEVVGEAGW